MAFDESLRLNAKEGQLEDFSNNAIAKSLSMKNRRAAGNWHQLVKAIEIQKAEKSTELKHDRNKLLGKRDEIETRTVSLSSKKSSASFQHEKPALLKVYNSLVASLEKEKRAKSGGVSESITRHTQSSERKKVTRKNVSISLNELQKRGPKASMKFKEQTVGDPQNIGSKDGGREHRTRPHSAFDYTEEEKDMNRRLYCSPTALPRIHLQTSYRPRFRSFDRDEEYRKKISVDEDSWKDIHQCRHLRLQKRSHTMHDLRSGKR